MSSLPPYSTFRTDSKQLMFPQAKSHGNILTFRPPGFRHELNVKFPDSRLAVCERCKKNFKTRDMCRVRNTHTSAPWTTAYICITVDESCTDGNGKYIDEPLTVRMVQWQPFCVKKPFDGKTPVCAACKRTNRTRSFCRERHKHRHLPWCTVYVLLSAVEATDPNTIVAGESKKVDEVGQDAEEEKPPASTEPTDDQFDRESPETNGIGSETISSDAGGEGDDINDIPASRTFLAKVSCRSTSIHWLDLSDVDPNEATTYGAPVPPEMTHYPPIPGIMDPSQHYMAQGIGYAAQQHQHALKSRQQYFFQMQQHQHQQHYAASQMQPQPPWQHHHHHPYGHAPMMPGPAPGQGDSTHQLPPPPPPPNANQQHPSPPTLHSGATAGEAAAAQQRRNQTGGSEDTAAAAAAHHHHQHQQHWTLYYPAPPMSHHHTPPTHHHPQYPPPPPPPMPFPNDGGLRQPSPPPHYHPQQPSPSPPDQPHPLHHPQQTQSESLPPQSETAAAVVVQTTSSDDQENSSIIPTESSTGLDPTTPGGGPDIKRQRVE